MLWDWIWRVQKLSLANVPTRTLSFPTNRDWKTPMSFFSALNDRIQKWVSSGRIVWLFTAFDFVMERRSWSFSSKAAFFSFPDMSLPTLLLHSSLQSSVFTIHWSSHTFPPSRESALCSEDFRKQQLAQGFIYVQGLSRRHMYILSASLKISRWHHCTVLSADPWCIIGVHMIMLEYPKAQQVVL